MNPFAIDTSDFQFLLDSIGETVIIDNVLKKCIIQNGNIGDYEDKYIYTLDSIQRGNLIVYNEKNYLIISDVTQGKYKKALMRKCTHTISVMIQEGGQILVGTTPWGEEIWETVDPVYDDFPCIVEQEKITIDGGQIRTSDSEILITLQDNEFTRKIKLNDVYNVAGYQYKVIHINYTKTGLLILKCETV
ncbi:Ig domain-containing protein [Anoxybacillus rupiensis]|uniref:Ig domain-containing protein n=1 Tax=Anoxybacteroides rupiense TaxID=311460 RepID=A0ABT5W084_9BACL|nr:Ig domain-containing protein [Anoxybacillus rupiensis]MDE8562744.1 Ig domain-containing protein [Anoxybacillus rupiensis]